MTPDPKLVAAARAFALPFYAEPGRAYHNAAHVEDMLAALHSRRVLTPELALACWGHDLVYDARATDNEERSAVIFDDWLAAQGVIRIPLNSCTVGTTPPVHPYREIRIFSYSFQSD